MSSRFRFIVLMSTAISAQKRYSVRLYNPFVLYGVIFMLVVCIYVYWCPTRFLYQIIFMSLNSNMTGVTGGAGTSNPFRAHEFTRNLFLCGCFTSVAAMLYQRKQNVEQELLSFPEHLRSFMGSCSSIINFLCSVL